MRRCVSFYDEMVPRSNTVKRVHAAALALATRGGPAALTMEGIAAEAGVGKQTLYRNWASVAAIVFDALAQDQPAPMGSSVSISIEATLAEAVDEISAEPRSSLLRALAALIQTDPAVARTFQERLLFPQLRQLEELVSKAEATDAARRTEMLLAPIFYRWFMRLPQLHGDQLTAHVRRVMAMDI